MDGRADEWVKEMSNEWMGWATNKLGQMTDRWVLWWSDE